MRIASAQLHRFTKPKLFVISLSVMLTAAVLYSPVVLLRVQVAFGGSANTDTSNLPLQLMAA